MNKKEITRLLDSYKDKQERTIVIVDYGNVEKWKKSLRWKIGIKELGQLARKFSKGNQELRRFYYGFDYGPKESSTILIEWSRAILEKAQMSKFFVSTKRVKYIHDRKNKTGFEKKCDFDVEMAIDLVRLRDLYDNIILFSGDGDLMCAINYLYEEYDKHCIIFGVRDHVGREVFDAQTNGSIDDILYAEDFSYRLNMARFW